MFPLSSRNFYHRCIRLIICQNKTFHIYKCYISLSNKGFSYIFSGFVLVFVNASFLNDPCLQSQFNSPKWPKHAKTEKKNFFWAINSWIRMFQLVASSWNIASVSYAWNVNRAWKISDPMQGTVTSCYLRHFKSCLLIKLSHNLFSQYMFLIKIKPILTLLSL